MGTQGSASQLRGPSLQGVFQYGPRYLSILYHIFMVHMHFMPHVSKFVRYVLLLKEMVTEFILEEQT
jgi:hypothetical protein